MEIQILLNPKTPNYSELQAELIGEITALQGSGVTITTKTAPPPKESLGFGEVFQYIINNREEITKIIPLLTAVVQVLVERLRRRNIIPPKLVRKPATSLKQKQKTKKSVLPKPEPIAIIFVGEHHLKLPLHHKTGWKFC